MKLRNYLTASVAVAGASVVQAANSTFQNPIISGFNPDPSCIFVPEHNNTFFCATSSFLVFPGLPIHASHDLVHWKHVSNGFSRADQLPGMAFLPRATSGMYAPTLRFHQGTFYLMCTLVNQQLPRTNDSRWDNFLITSKDPYSSEAWSDPVHFSFPGFDPSPFWDDDGTTWVSGAHTAAYYPGVMHAPLNFETGEIGDIIMPWNGTGGASPEAPHIWKRDGWYYLLLAEGGTRENHMVTMARSKSIRGPYEPAPGNPLLTAANNTESYFQAVGHADLFQDANGKWWAAALAVRAGGSYGQAPGPYFGNLPMGRETVLTAVTWDKDEFPVFDPISGTQSGWQLPTKSIPQQGEGQLSDADDTVTFPPGSSLPIHFVHWRLPKSRNYRVSPRGHKNTLALKSSVLNLTAFDADFALGRGQTFVGRRMAHSLFKYSVEVDYEKSLSKEEMEVGVAAIQDQAQHFDLGVVMLRSKQGDALKPHIRFRGHSETPYRGRTFIQTNVVEVPKEWAKKKLKLQIEAVNSTHFAFSAGPVEKRGQAKLSVFGHCRGTDLVPYYSGVVVGVYATSNGKHGEQAFETYISNWVYKGTKCRWVHNFLGHMLEHDILQSLQSLQYAYGPSAEWQKHHSPQGLRLVAAFCNPCIATHGLTRSFISQQFCQIKSSDVWRPIRLRNIRLRHSYVFLELRAESRLLSAAMSASPSRKAQPANEAPRGGTEDDELRPLFNRILDIIKSREVFRTSPTFFVVYAWDNGSGTAVSDAVQDFIRVCERAGCEIKSDQEPAVRAVTEQQLCLLPLGAHPSAVELVVLCASDLLGHYMTRPDFQDYVDDMVMAYKANMHNSEHNFVGEVYEKHYKRRIDRNSSLHHVETELALLKIRANSGQKTSIIPLILNGDYRVNLPAYLSGHNDILRTVIGPKPDGDGSKSECFLKVLERLAERGKHAPGPASLIQSLRKLYTSTAKQLNTGTITAADLEEMILRQIDAANRLSDTWTDSQRLPINNNESKEMRRYQRRVDILKALHTSPYRDRKDINMNRVPGTCKWFVGHKLFRQWLGCKTSSMLWVSADPGCGKSVLAKHLVDSVLPLAKSRTICYFFFKDDFDDQKSAKSALCCVLHQLFEQKPDLLSEKIAERFEAYGERLTGSVSELWNILTLASKEVLAGEIICVFDAFDECDEQGRKELAQVLCSYYSTRSKCNLKVLLTSRPYGDIRRIFQPIDIPGLPVIHLSGESEEELHKISREIDIYIKSRVKNIQTTLRLTPDDCRLLLEQMLRIPHRTYLWAHLTLDLIKDNNSIDQMGLRKATSQLPPTIDHAYEMILSKSTDAVTAKRLLHIVVAAARPLTLLEMGFALTVRENDRSYKSMDLKSEYRLREYLREICGLFVSVIDSRIYLLHQTAKEFLVRKEMADVQEVGSNKFEWKSTFSPQESHKILSQVCMWHLLFTEFDDEPLEDIYEMPEYLDAHIFLEYSARHWGTHVIAAGLDDPTMVDLSVKLCDSETKRFLTWFNIHWAGTHSGAPKDFTALMAASYLGLAQAVSFMLKRRTVAINSCDGTYKRTPLSWASEYGFTEVVKLLIGGPSLQLRDVLNLNLSFLRRTVIDTKDIYGRTPLSYACWNGNTDIIELLVNAGARADIEDEIGGTPMSYAIINGQKSVASLVKKNVKRMQIDSEDAVSKTLLLSAAQKGHDTVVKLLLENSNVDVNVRTVYGDTSLGLAAKEGHNTVIRLLLSRRNIDVNAVDGFNRTPLLWAAANGHYIAMELLVGTGRVDVNLKDTLGRTALSWAAEGEQCLVVEQLLRIDDIDVDSKDVTGRTPLSRASSGAIVTALFRTGRVDCDSKDGLGRTPLSWASIGSKDEVIRVLLDCASFTINVDSKDDSGRTPLSYAAGQGNTHALKLLLSRSIDANLADASGRTPLSWVADCGNTAAVKTLLASDFVDVNAKDESGWTPLFWAIRKKHHGAFELLIRNSKIKPDSVDNYGRTPLSWAAAEGLDDMVDLLVQQKVHLNIKDKTGRTPLLWAMEAKNSSVIKRMLMTGFFHDPTQDNLNDVLILDNQTEEAVEICKAPYGPGVTICCGEIRTTPDLRAGMQLCLRYLGVDLAWSAPFSTSEEGNVDIKITKADQRQRLVRAGVSRVDGLTLIRLSKQTFWPISMENRSDVEFIFMQEQSRIFDDDAWEYSLAKGWEPIRYRLPARSIMPYSWDHTTARDKAILLLSNGVTHRISLSTPGPLPPFDFTVLSRSRRKINIKIVASSEDKDDANWRITCVISNFNGA
ncbi:Non-reducing end alpha-L-arabinofuranosidase BoGH43A [Paramyrothecium foliicola]|nr:Non-reducing end alpha-L-arabinofuranosidase BoGH43A [Paramyrothecium foliicola]